MHEDIYAFTDIVKEAAMRSWSPSCERAPDTPAKFIFFIVQKLEILAARIGVRNDSDLTNYQLHASK